MPHEVTVDIDRLDDGQLEQLASILYYTQGNPTGAQKLIWERVAFLRGWMSPEAERRYAEGR